MKQLCRQCGLDLALVGRVHRCVSHMANSDSMANSMANSGVEKQSSRVAHNHETAGAAPASATNAYRYRDQEKRKAYMRAYMQRRRGKQ